MGRDADGTRIRIAAPAKVNLFLHVLAREASGFHQLETAFLLVDFCDELIVERGVSGITLHVTGREVGPPRENLAWRAAEAFLAAVDPAGGVRLVLEKRIPPGAGLGGGSSDAAATLLAMNLLWGRPLSRHELVALGGTLGSDVPFFASGSALSLAWGRGDRLLGLPPLPTAPLVLALPDLHVPTADAYRRLAAARETQPRAVSRALALDSLRSWGGVAALAENDFEPTVLASFEPLAQVRSALANSGARCCLLSGSGGALFAVYPDESVRSHALRELVERFPDVAFVPTRSLESAPSPGAGADLER